MESVSNQAGRGVEFANQLIHCDQAVGRRVQVPPVLDFEMKRLEASFAIRGLDGKLLISSTLDLMNVGDH